MPKSAKSKCSHYGKYFATDRGRKVYVAKSHNLNRKPPFAPKLKPQLVDVDVDRISVASLEYSTTLETDRSSEPNENLSPRINQDGHGR